MRINIQCNRTVLWGLAMLLLLAASDAHAQQPLRWKFEPGQKLNYNMVQEMTIGSTGGPFGAQNVTMNQEMDMTWDVQRVTEDGDAVIRQLFNRMKMKMNLPAPAGVVEYDSQSQTPPTGLAAMFAPMYQALTKAEFELTISPRGEVKDVKVPDEVIAALKNSPGAMAMGDLATPQGFKKMISQSSLVLPENAPQPNEQWSTKVELNNPTGGKQIIETTYTYQGTKELEGTTFAVFRPDLKMSFENNPQMKVKAQESSGEILFNVEAGRLHSSALDQSVTMEQGAGVQAKIDQVIKVKVTPLEESAPGN